MFEKDAKAYKEIVMKEHLQNPFPRSVEDVWQDGAEFGYNKANEWHYVKDGDLPKDDKPVLVYREDDEPQLDCYLNEEGYWKSEKWDREYYSRKGENPPISSIVAWKEIVPPKECV